MKKLLFLLALAGVLLYACSDDEEDGNTDTPVEQDSDAGGTDSDNGSSDSDSDSDSDNDSDNGGTSDISISPAYGLLSYYGDDRGEDQGHRFAVTLTDEPLAFDNGYEPDPNAGFSLRFEIVNTSNEKADGSFTAFATDSCNTEVLSRNKPYCDIGVLAMKDGKSYEISNGRAMSAGNVSIIAGGQANAYKVTYDVTMKTDGINPCDSSIRLKGSFTDVFIYEDKR